MSSCLSLTSSTVFRLLGFVEVCFATLNLTVLLVSLSRLQILSWRSPSRSINAVDMSNMSEAPVERIAVGFKMSGLCYLTARLMPLTHISMKSVPTRMSTGNVYTITNTVLARRSPSPR